MKCRKTPGVRAFGRIVRVPEVRKKSFYTLFPGFNPPVIRIKWGAKALISKGL